MSSLQKLLGVAKVKGKTGDVDVATLEGKIILVYFSAHWCPPCRAFTPMLAKFYENLKSKRDDFEIIFVSSDRNQEEFEDYYREHPWLAHPFKNRQDANIVSTVFGVRGIPTLAVVDGQGKTITTQGRDFVLADPQGKLFPWKDEQPKTPFRLPGFVWVILFIIAWMIFRRM